MTGYYDDNFGHWDMESEEDYEFYQQCQRNSVWKTCSICGRRVKILPQYDKCDSCASKIERGFGY